MLTLIAEDESILNDPELKSRGPGSSQTNEISNLKLNPR